ncbi:unnamed protein product, partial [Rotaria magnacalcarata]
MKDYSTAITYLQRALQIRENKLPKNHPDLAVTYHSLAKSYIAAHQYDMAMKNAQQAVDIAKEKLPSTHPHLLEYRKTSEQLR